MLKRHSLHSVAYSAVADTTGLSSFVIVSEICEIPRNSPIIRTYSSLRSSEVIELGTNRKRISNFLLVININVVRISYRFRDIDAFRSKIALFSCFPIPPLFDAPQRRNALRYQRNLYAAGKDIQWATIPSLTLQVYLRSFSRCCLPKSRKTREIPKKI